MALTEVRQDAADYNRCFGKWKDYLPLVSITDAPPRAIGAKLGPNRGFEKKLGSTQCCVINSRLASKWHFVMTRCSTIARQDGLLQKYFNSSQQPVAARPDGRFTSEILSEPVLTDDACKDIQANIMCPTNEIHTNAMLPFLSRARQLMFVGQQWVRPRFDANLPV